LDAVMKNITENPHIFDKSIPEEPVAEDAAE
jgi:hypothetical protein